MDKHKLCGNFIISEVLLTLTTTNQNIPINLITKLRKKIYSNKSAKILGCINY